MRKKVKNLLLASRRRTSPRSGEPVTGRQLMSYLVNRKIWVLRSRNHQAIEMRNQYGEGMIVIRPLEADGRN